MMKVRDYSTWWPGLVLMGLSISDRPSETADDFAPNEGFSNRQPSLDRGKTCRERHIQQPLSLLRSTSALFSFRNPRVSGRSGSMSPGEDVAAGVLKI